MRSPDVAKTLLPVSVRRGVSGFICGCRRLSPAARALPTFMIIGAPRGGTTSLWKYLTAHPDVAGAWLGRKEIHFFDLQFQRGMTWYRSFFPTKSTIDRHERRSGRRLLVGEASPDYLAHPLAAGRIAYAIPDARLVVLLRHPVDRIVSRYHQLHNRGAEVRTVEEALTQELAMCAGVVQLAELGRRKSPVAERLVGFPGYISESLYAYHLRPWLEAFPRNQFLFVKSEHLYEAPAETLARVQTFLGLCAAPMSEYSRYHASGLSAQAIDVRPQLVAFFRPHNEELYRLLGEDFWWDEWGARPESPSRTDDDSR